MPTPFQRKRTMDSVEALVGREAGRLVLGHYPADDAGAETAVAGPAGETLDAALPSHVAIKRFA